MFYAESHEWVDVGDHIGDGLPSNETVATIGITEYAQKELGDIVYVECPKVGKIARKGEVVAVLESTKAAVDVYSPVSGRIVEVNTSLQEYPELINSAPEKTGWIFRIALQDPKELQELLSETAYRAKCQIS